jgi:hypothetical protein
MASADLLLHPVRLRIVKAFLGDRALSRPAENRSSSHEETTTSESAVDAESRRSAAAVEAHSRESCSLRIAPQLLFGDTCN